jgi:hypothetical protein
MTLKDLIVAVAQHIQSCFKGGDMTKMKLLSVPFVFAGVLWASASSAQVLGACGTPSENEPAKVEKSEEQGQLVSRSVPLPGQHAINFELPAVIGDEIKTVKLSDYNGHWRVLCFYPADFTFV